MIHADFRADNLFFIDTPDGIEVAVLDWQSPNVSAGAYDVAYFVCGSLDVGLVASDGERLLRRYHDALLHHGVSNYPRGRFEEDYRASLLAYLCVFIINGATIDPTNERGAELFRVIFDRLACAITATNALALLDS